MEMELEELARQAGVLPRTVRYYVSEGLLPPPLYGKPAKYTEEHLERLMLIKRLQKELYMPLDKIRERFAKQTTDQIRDYLEQALSREVELQGEQDQIGLSPIPSAASSGFAAQDSALDYIQNLLARPSRQAHAAPPPTAAPTPYSAAPVRSQEAGEARLRKAQRAFSVNAENDSQPVSPSTPTTDTWTRVTLAPGIELNFLASDDPEFKSTVARILKAVAEAGLLQGPEKEST